MRKTGKKIISVFLIIIFMFNITGCATDGYMKIEKSNDENIKTNKIPIVNKNDKYREEYKKYVPDFYLKQYWDWGPYTMAWTSMYLQSIRFTNLTLEDWRFTFRLLSLPVLIPLLAWIYNDFNDNTKLQVMKYLSNHNHSIIDKEIAGKSFYNNTWNSKYFEYKSEIPEVSESLKSRIEFYSKVKEYGIPLMALGFTILELYSQYRITAVEHLHSGEYTDYSPLFWPIIIVPVIIPPLLDFELYSYNKYNDVVPDIYKVDENIINLIILITVFTSMFYYKGINPAPGIGYYAFATFPIAGLLAYIDGWQQKNIKTVRYIYEMQKFEKENKRGEIKIENK